MSNPTYNATPVQFDPPDAPEELYTGLTMVKSGVSFISPAGCALAVYAWYQGVTP